MYWTAAIRTAILGSALLFTPVVNADPDLDEMIMTKVMPRFDKKARVSMRKSGARYISTRWDSETRTLVAVGELDALESPEISPVAWRTVESSRSQDLKEAKVDEICQYTGVRMIKDFLEKHAIKIAFIYSERSQLADPLIIEISHNDLGVCV